MAVNDDDQVTCGFKLILTALFQCIICGHNVADLCHMPHPQVAADRVDIQIPPKDIAGGCFSQIFHSRPFEVVTPPGCSLQVVDHGHVLVHHMNNLPNVELIVVEHSYPLSLVLKRKWFTFQESFFWCLFVTVLILEMIFQNLR